MLYLALFGDVHFLYKEKTAMKPAADPVELTESEPLAEAETPAEAEEFVQPEAA